MAESCKRPPLPPWSPPNLLHLRVHRVAGWIKGWSCGRVGPGPSSKTKFDHSSCPALVFFTGRCCYQGYYPSAAAQHLQRYLKCWWGARLVLVYESNNDRRRRFQNSRSGLYELPRYVRAWYDLLKCYSIFFVWAVVASGRPLGPTT